MAKLNFRWRTALVLRELEEEIEALARGRRHRELLKVGRGLGPACLPAWL